MRPAIVSVIVSGDALVSYWPIFFPVPSNSPRSLCESQLSPVSFLFLKWRIEEGVRGRVKARYDGGGGVGEKEKEGKEDSSLHPG